MLWKARFSLHVWGREIGKWLEESQMRDILLLYARIPDFYRNGTYATHTIGRQYYECYHTLRTHNLVLAPYNLINTLPTTNSSLAPTGQKTTTLAAILIGVDIEIQTGLGKCISCWRRFYRLHPGNSARDDSGWAGLGGVGEGVARRSRRKS